MIVSGSVVLKIIGLLLTPTNQDDPGLSFVPILF